MASAKWDNPDKTNEHEVTENVGGPHPHRQRYHKKYEAQRLIENEGLSPDDERVQKAMLDEEDLHVRQWLAKEGLKRAWEKRKQKETQQKIRSMRAAAASERLPQTLDTNFRDGSSIPDRMHRSRVRVEPHIEPGEPRMEQPVNTRLEEGELDRYHDLRKKGPNRTKDEEAEFTVLKDRRKYRQTNEAEGKWHYWHSGVFTPTSAFSYQSGPGKKTRLVTTEGPSQEELKGDLDRYNHLREKNLDVINKGNPKGLTGSERAEYEKLVAKGVPDYKRIEYPDRTGRLSKDVREDYIQKKLLKLDPSTQRSYRIIPSFSNQINQPDRFTEDIPEKVKPEDVIGKHNQEALKPRSKEPKASRYKEQIDKGYITRKTSREHRLKAQFGPKETLKDKISNRPLAEGWKRTTKFNLEQLGHTREAVSGRSITGWTPGSGIQAPDKAKLTFGPNEEWAVKTNQWQLVHPEQASSTQDKFFVTVKDSGDQPVAETVKDLGLDINVRNLGDNKFVLYSDKGQHLNDDDISLLKESLHTHHALGSFKVVKREPFTRHKYNLPLGYSRVPKNEKEENIALMKQKNIYSDRFGARFGERDLKGDLLPGRSDTLGINVKGRALQANFREDTDAIGWGTSWRPGQKEISGAVMALPNARRQRELADAWDSWDKTGNEEDINSYMAKYHPYDETEYEKDERKSKLKKEGKILVAAGAASGYKTARDHTGTELVNQAWARAEAIPKLGESLQGKREFIQGKRQGNYGPGVLKDVRWGLRRPLANKWDRAVWRIQNPLKSGAVITDPVTGDKKIVEDPTVSGFMSHKAVNLPSVRYRSKLIDNEAFEMRQMERQLFTLKGISKSRAEVQRVLTGEIPASAAKRKVALIKARTMSRDYFRKSTEGWQENLEHQQQELRKKIPQMKGDDPFVDLKNTRKRWSQVSPELQDALRRNDAQLQRMINHAKRHPELYSHESLKDLITEYMNTHPSKKIVQKTLFKTGKVGLAGGVIAGAGLLGADAYQNYERNKTGKVNHPVLKAITPERIAIPRFSAKATQKYIVPDNSITSALDFQGMQVPLAGRVSMKKEEKMRLRNHKDISGQPYKSNLPLIGGLGVRAPAPVKGSIAKSVLPETKQTEIGPSKNLYVMGKKSPINVAMGKKERWGKGQLRAKNNRFSLSQDDREKLTALASDSTEAREQIESFYHGNQKLEDMLSDNAEIDRARKKNIYWLAGAKKKPDQSFKRVYQRDENVLGRTMEEAASGRRAERAAERGERNTRTNYSYLGSPAQQISPHRSGR